MQDLDDLTAAVISFIEDEPELAPAIRILKFEVIDGAALPCVLDCEGTLKLQVSRDWIRRRNRSALKMELSEIAIEVLSSYPSLLPPRQSRPQRLH